MKSVKYDKGDIISLIKLNVVEWFGGDVNDYFVKIGKVNAEVVRKDKKELKIKL